MDQRGDGRGAGHGVGQPDVERDLCGLAARADHQQDADQREQTHWRGRRMLEHIGEIEGLELAEDQKHRQRKTEVADAVHDERLVARIRGEFLIEIEAN